MGNSFDDGFDGSIPQTQQDIERAMRDGLLSLDANVLLNFYRYSPKARDALVDVLTAAGDRVFVCHQAAREFWRNRIRVIDDRRSVTEQLGDALSKGERSVQSALGNWAKQTAVPQDVRQSVLDKLSAAMSDLQELVDQESTESGSIAYEAGRDSVVAVLRSILDGKVGPPLSSEDYAAAVKEAEARVKDRVPPGFRDAEKAEAGAADGVAGDYLVWRQSLLEAKARSLPLVIVTGDEKEDWWWRHRSEFFGPRGELVDECRGFAQQPLFMLRPVDLMENAKFLNVTVTDEARTDVALKSDAGDDRWTRLAVAELLQRLDDEGAVQAEIIRAAAENGGRIDRAEIFSIAGYDEDRMLRGFTRPTRRITQDLQDEGVLGAGVEQILVPLYFTGVTAKQFQVPAEVVEFLSDGRPLRGRSRLETDGDEVG